jgi:hypothetical protein
MKGPQLILFILGYLCIYFIQKTSGFEDAVVLLLFMIWWSQ